MLLAHADLCYEHYAQKCAVRDREECRHASDELETTWAASIHNGGSFNGLFFLYDCLTQPTDL